MWLRNDFVPWLTLAHCGTTHLSSNEESKGFQTDAWLGAGGMLAGALDECAGANARHTSPAAVEVQNDGAQ